MLGLFFHAPNLCSQMLSSLAFYGIKAVTYQAVSLKVLEDDGIYIPERTVIQYWDGSNWQDVTCQSKFDDFLSGTPQKITFADNGTVFVLPAISANSAALVQVISENGLKNLSHSNSEYLLQNKAIKAD